MKVLSGIQPSGELHLGNYFGAIRQYVRMQEEHDCFFFVANYHALTSLRDAPRLRQLSLSCAADYLALGLDPNRATIFLQSDLPEVTELTWLLDTVTPMGLLQRCHAYKEKIEQGLPSDHGLFAYPVLMAADILVYHATRVPVGDDQRQHLELANDIGQKFNFDFCGGEPFFPVIEPLILGPAARVMSLRDGSKKMSKSDPSDQSRINLTDEPDTIALKIRRAKTDPEPLPTEPAGLESRPEARNLVGIYAAMEDTDYATVLRTHGGRGFGDFKRALADLLIAKLSPIAGEMRRLLDDTATIDAILRDGALRASALAGPIVQEAERLVGFLRV